MKTRPFLLLMALLGLAPIHADIGPRPPVGRVEVTDPQDWLAMRSENVQVVLTGADARVEASFHFETVRTDQRNRVAMRLGFPQLKADRPLRGFTVAQSVYVADTPPLEMTPVHVIKAGPVNPELDNGLRADWRTWQLTLPSSSGRPMDYAVDAKVQYAQALTPLAGGKARFTYVLRSGAPWAETIGRATVQVRLDGATLVSARPRGYARGGETLTWSLKSFEPSRDVVVVVRPKR